MIHHIVAPWLANFAILAFLAIAPASAETEATLQMEWSADKLTFRLAGDVGTNPWVLQHSVDGKVWEDVIFLRGEENAPSATIAPSELPLRGERSALFRATQLERDDPDYREFLDARALWRTSSISAISSYRYELRWNFSFFLWHGTATVANGKVTEFETIELLPSFAEAPEVPTIDDLFDKIADARARDAATIEVTWHPEFGFPSSAFIDLSLLIADEEQGWTIKSFSPGL